VIEKTSLFNSAQRPDIYKFGRSHSEIAHKVVIAVQQLNLDVLETLVRDIADPDSKNYGKHKSMADIQDMTSNTVSTNYVISYFETTWLHEQFKIEKSIFGDFITGKSC
jgi:subtilase family serine protease